MIEQEQLFLDYSTYQSTARLDEIRRNEYCYLDRSDRVYLDYTGSGLAAIAQYQAHAARLMGDCFGNPHSENPTSKLATDLVEHTRQAILAYFSASPEEYVAIFTANASAACRLVGESYPFGKHTSLVLTFDNHNSVNGIREFAKGKSARVTYIPSRPVDLRVDNRAVLEALARYTPRDLLGAGLTHTRHRGLFAYPAQSNFTGVQHPLDWIELAHEHGYDVLLDAAAYLPTNSLDLSIVHPDFVTVSWYKLFGYPTGIGCLIARKEALSRLRRPWFSGGTIQAVSVQGDWHMMAAGESAFEDGTVNFLSIPDVEFGLSWLSNIGIDLIRTRVRWLTGWLLHHLTLLAHDSGAPMIRIYGPTTTSNRGGTIAFNFLDPDGMVVDERLVEREASAAGFSLRTGCFCNPGAGEGAFAITEKSLRGKIGHGIRTIDDYLSLLNLPSGGAIRVSLGLVSTLDDVQRFLDFVVSTYRNRPASTQGLTPRERC